MAARKKNWHPDIVRERIQRSQLVNVLLDHAVKGRKMDPTRVTAGLGLLKKVLPDLAAIDNTHTGKDGGPILISNVDSEL